MAGVVVMGLVDFDLTVDMDTPKIGWQPNDRPDQETDPEFS